jgi:hypothetical protein
MVRLFAGVSAGIIVAISGNSRISFVSTFEHSFFMGAHRWRLWLCAWSIQI